jgi:hypothetical protein
LRWGCGGGGVGWGGGGGGDGGGGGGGIVNGILARGIMKGKSASSLQVLSLWH